MTISELARLSSTELKDIFADELEDMEAPEIEGVLLPSIYDLEEELGNWKPEKPKSLELEFLEEAFEGFGQGD